MNKPNSQFTIGPNKVGNECPTYFIADIAANHDGDIERAKDLIFLAAEKGANAAKFQHFNANSIVSDYGFKNMGGQKSHQASWKKSVFEVYKDASVSMDWSETLKATCDKANVDFFTSPYSFDLVDHIDSFVSAFKIGSGDITWTDLINYISKKNKPVIIASGASTTDDVIRSVNTILEFNQDVCLMQCNTNYTASLENFKYIQLNVLKVYREMYPNIVLGLSDHTPGHTTVLGSVAYGARVIEKHLTDDTSRVGPDHAFSMDGNSWEDMVLRTRELEHALGDGVKKIEKNELETCIVQRRSICASKDLEAGQTITNNDLDVLRPCPSDGIPPYEIQKLINRELKNNLKKGQHISWKDLK